MQRKGEKATTVPEAVKGKANLPYPSLCVPPGCKYCSLCSMNEAGDHSLLYEEH